MKKIFTIGLFTLLPLIMITLLAYKGISFWSLRSFTVMSGSMEPNLPVGSLVFTIPLDGYRIGDVIAFTRNNETITHRIAKKEINGNIFSFSTKGDANNAIDTQRITQDKIIGKEIIMLPFVGRLIGFIRTVPGFLIFIVLPSILFIGFELWDIKKELEKEIEKKLLARFNSHENNNNLLDKMQNLV